MVSLSVWKPRETFHRGGRGLNEVSGGREDQMRLGAAKSPGTRGDGEQLSRGVSVGCERGCSAERGVGSAGPRCPVCTSFSAVAEEPLPMLKPGQLPSGSPMEDGSQEEAGVRKPACWSRRKRLLECGGEGVA